VFKGRAPQKLNAAKIFRRKFWLKAAKIAAKTHQGGSQEAAVKGTVPLVSFAEKFGAARKLPLVAKLLEGS
jgi:hypothetical protein